MNWKLLFILSLVLVTAPMVASPDPLPGDHNIDLCDDQECAIHAGGYETPYTAHCTECHGQCLQGDGTIPTCYRCHDRIWSEAPPSPECSVYTCDGFAPPMALFPVSFKRNHAIPLRAEIFDQEGYEVTGDDVDLPPVVQVWLYAGDEEPADYSDEALPPGSATEGNQFYFTESGLWEFILGTTNFSAPGRYEVSLGTSPQSGYLIEKTCVTEFVVE